MFKELETERLYLKNISLEDTEFIYDEFSNDTVNRYLFDEEPIKEREEAEGIIKFYTLSTNFEQHRWILVQKSDGVKIGTCGFHRWDKKTGRIEVGYDMLPSYWGKGYMQEAMNAILVFMKENLAIKRIDAHIYPENTNSLQLAKRLGFTKSDETINYEFRGKNYIHDIYSKYY